MTTLAEIESAVDRLPLNEQEKLLSRLGAKMRQRRGEAGPALREQWMERLEGLRTSIGAGEVTLATEQILADSREERG